MNDRYIDGVGRPVQRIRHGAWVLGAFLVLAVVASACGDSSSDTDSTDQPVEDVADDNGGTADGSGGDAPAELFFAGDFDSACRGIGIAAAAPHVEGDGQPYIVALVGADPEYGAASIGLPDGWEAPFEEIASTELVVCLNRTSETSVEVCTGYEDEGLAWEVETFAATYEVTLRDANTATEIDSTSLDATPDGCPMFSIYSEGDPSPVPDHATPDAALEAWLAPHMVG